MSTVMKCPQCGRSDLVVYVRMPCHFDGREVEPLEHAVAEDQVEGSSEICCNACRYSGTWADLITGDDDDEYNPTLEQALVIAELRLAAIERLISSWAAKPLHDLECMLQAIQEHLPWDDDNEGNSWTLVSKCPVCGERGWHQCASGDPGCMHCDACGHSSK